MVHGFVADVSDLNPNVMLELGITEADAGRRPVVILRRQGSADLPADLRGLLYVEYELPTANEPDRIGHLVALLREKLRTIEAADELRHHRLATADLVHGDLGPANVLITTQSGCFALLREDRTTRRLQHSSRCSG